LVRYLNHLTRYALNSSVDFLLKKIAMI
jgi:hypothetical protein